MGLRLEREARQRLHVTEPDAPRRDHHRRRHALPAAGAFNRIVQILATQNSAYALGSDGRVYAWGSGSDYALGNDATSNSSLPIDISGFGVFAQLSPNTGAGATRAPRRIVQLGGGPINDGQHVLAIDDRGIA